jgi:hypothetical protein
MTQPSETPRTDEIAHSKVLGTTELKAAYRVLVDVARQLERELSAAREEVERMKNVGRWSYWHDAFRVAEGLREDAERRCKDAKSRAAEARERTIEECAKVCEQIYGGKAHTYASENADIYRAQDRTIASCAKAIRALSAGKGDA